MYCKNCGNAINNKMKYCNNCGTKIIISEDTQPNEVEMYKQNNYVAMLFSIVYAVIATWYIVSSLGIIEVLVDDCFNSTGAGIFIGICIIVIFILYLISAFVGCMTLVNKWYSYMGGFALIACVLGVIYGPIKLFLGIARGQMELELGYSDPNMSDIEVHNEYQKLQAIRKINGRR